MKIILIVAIGRTGSTTLQRLVNTIKNSHITGEKNFEIIKLLESYNNLKLCTEYEKRKKNRKNRKNIIEK